MPGPICGAASRGRYDTETNECIAEDAKPSKSSRPSAASSKPESLEDSVARRQS